MLAETRGFVRAQRGKRSATERYIISNCSYCCKYKSAKHNGAIEKGHAFSAFPFLLRLTSEPTLVETRGFEPLTYTLRARSFSSDPQRFVNKTRPSSA